jgi:hypothetical protein
MAGHDFGALLQAPTEALGDLVGVLFELDLDEGLDRMPEL